SKMKRILTALEQKYEREPTTLAISQALELAPTDVKKAIKNAGRYISMDAPLSHDEEGNMYDVLLSEDAPCPDHGLLTDSLCKEIDRALNTLTQREAEIIRLYYGLNGKHSHTLEEIGEEFNITRERIRQIKAKGISRLKHISKSRVLKTYMG
ncbi:MAG: sigma-70 family RNA polymerase sigma factor, partial [Bacteroidales bacterium]|nr:sigma-70 family RNA polymerase sigma factor [Bacteroidales bacterium]